MSITRLDVYQGERVTTLLPRAEVRKRILLLGDEEVDAHLTKDKAEYHHESRTSPANLNWKYPCTPSVMRFFKEPREDQGDFRVNIAPLLLSYLALNGENDIEDPKSRYLFNSGTALFNDKGYPSQAYLSMSGNELRGEFVGDWLRFETLTPARNVAGMTHETHPWYVHRFDLVCWNATEKRTYHKPVKYGWEIDYYLVSAEGVGWIQKKYVKVIG